jgi:hypothetical protein
MNVFLHEVDMLLYMLKEAQENAETEITPRIQKASSCWARTMYIPKGYVAAG